MDLILRLEASCHTGKDSSAADDVARSQGDEFHLAGPFLPQEHAKGGLRARWVQLGKCLFCHGTYLFGHGTSMFRFRTYLFDDGTYLFSDGKYLFHHGTSLFHDGPGLSPSEKTSSLTENTFSVTEHPSSSAELPSSMTEFTGTSADEPRSASAQTASSPENEAFTAQAWVSVPEVTFSRPVPTRSANPTISPTWHNPQ